MIGKGITGKDAEAALGKANLTVNKNAVPNDPQKPFVTSGLRIGTPAVTTRGYKETDCLALANWMCDVLDNPKHEQVIHRNSVVEGKSVSVRVTLGGGVSVKNNTRPI